MSILPKNRQDFPKRPYCRYSITPADLKTREIVMLFGIFLALSACGSNVAGAAVGTGNLPSGRDGVIQVVMEKPSDPEKAIQSEYERLKNRGTREGLELFIARHPDHPLAERAREEIKRLYD